MNFDKNQKEAINFYKGCCNVIATAGSGKTSVLVNRIENLVDKYNVPPQNILAITFSKKAKDTIKDKLSLLLPEIYSAVQIETFHSLGYKIIKRFSNVSYEILSYDWKKQKMLTDLSGSDISDIDKVIQYISLCKNNLESSQSGDTYGDLFTKYEKEKEKKHLIDYDDMLTKSYDILKHDKLALEFCQEQFKFILIDEIQDINKVQYEIVKMIADKYKNLFVVGDIFQNIFEWRGSNNSFVINFNKDWENVKTINLNTNYRSSKDIVEFSNKFSQYLPEHTFKFYKQPVANRMSHLPPQYKRYNNEFDEAKGISKQILQLISSESYGYKDIAILARTNSQLQTFETVFFDNHIPCQVTNDISFVDRKEIKIVMSYLKLASDINDNESFEYIYNKPNRWLGKAFLKEVKHYASVSHMSLYCAMFKAERNGWKYKNGIEDLCTIISGLKHNNFANVGKQVKYIRDKLNIDKFVSSDINNNAIDSNRIENLDSLERIASQYKDVKEFINYTVSIGKDKMCLQDCVQLLTIHKSKGMEFPVVFLVGMNDGTLPHSKSHNLNEEKRLAYVAITRAEDELYCSSLRIKNRKRLVESPFIKMMFD